jgi:hypothetical protein
MFAVNGPDIRHLDRTPAHGAEASDSVAKPLHVGQSALCAAASKQAIDYVFPAKLARDHVTPHAGRDVARCAGFRQ